MAVDMIARGMAANNSEDINTLEGKTLPNVTGTDNGKVLQVYNGNWSPQNLPYNGLGYDLVFRLDNSGANPAIIPENITFSQVFDAINNNSYFTAAIRFKSSLMPAYITKYDTTKLKIISYRIYYTGEYWVLQTTTIIWSSEGFESVTPDMRYLTIASE